MFYKPLIIKKIVIARKCEALPYKVTGQSSLNTVEWDCFTFLTASAVFSGLLRPVNRTRNDGYRYKISSVCK